MTYALANTITHTSASSELICGCDDKECMTTPPPDAEQPFASKADALRAMRDVRYSPTDRYGAKNPDHVPEYRAATLRRAVPVMTDPYTSGHSRYSRPPGA